MKISTPVKLNRLFKIEVCFLDRLKVLRLKNMIEVLALFIINVFGIIMNQRNVQGNMRYIYILYILYIVLIYGVTVMLNCYNL